MGHSSAPAASGRVGLGSGSGVWEFQDETPGLGEQLKASGTFLGRKGLLNRGRRRIWGWIITQGVSNKNCELIIKE